MDAVRRKYHAKKEAAKWERRLDREGLGVVDIICERGGLNLHNSKSARGRKHAWLEGRLIGEHYQKGSSEYMSPSPYTAQAVESRFFDEGSVDMAAMAGHTLVTELGMIESDIERAEASEFYGESDHRESVLDALALSLTASRKEAELADRSRQTVLGFDKWGIPLKGDRRLMLTARQRNENRRAAERGLPPPHETNPFMTEVKVRNTDVVMRAPLRCDYFKKEQGLPCAHSDAGNGPLAIKDNPKQEPVSDRAEGENVRMSPLVPTLGYHPGRGPYEMSLMAAINSDITG